MLNQRVLSKAYGLAAKWWDSMAACRKNGLVFAGFLGFFLLMLLPIPHSGSILGTVDTLFIPAMSNTFLNRIRAVLFGEFVGQALYPADIARYGESSVGVASIFILFRSLGINDIYALYLTQVSLLSLMAYATMLLAKRYTQSFSSAVFAAFVFSTSNFLWADIDNLPIHFYFLPLLSAYFLKKAIQQKNTRTLLAAGVAGGLQMYFSVQVYIYQTLILAVMLLFSLPELWRAYSMREKSLFVFSYALIPLPLFLYYLNTVINLGVADPFPRTQWEQFYSLHPSDFLKALPNKFIRYPFTSTSAGGWHRAAHSAFVGVATPVLALVGLKGLSKQKLELVAIGLVGLLFAMGTTIDLGRREFASPLALFYRFVPLAKYLRVELRSYSVALLAMSILASLGWRRIARRLGRWSRKLPSVALVLVFLFVAAENISWPLNTYETVEYPAIPEGYVEFFRDKPDALILDLPSHSASWPGYIDEIIYVLWQTNHQRNILGGVSGYYPLSRIETQGYADLLPSEEAFHYFRGLGVTHFVWHDSSFLVCHIPHSELGCDPSTGTRPGMVAEGYSWVEGSPFLRLVFENDVIRVYELR